MWNGFMRNMSNSFNQLRVNDTVIVTDENGKTTGGKLKEYTSDSIVIQEIRDVKFDVKKVTIEKIN